MCNFQYNRLNVNIIGDLQLLDLEIRKGIEERKRRGGEGGRPHV